MRPDLTVLGKTIGGGFPIGALGGRADVMSLFDPRREDRIAHSGTFNGNPISMSAGRAALELLTDERIQHIDDLGERLAAGFRSIFDRAALGACVTRAGSLAQIHLTPGPVRDYRSAARADRRLRALLHLALLNRGVFCGSRLNFNTSTVMTGAAIERAVSALGDVLEGWGEVLRDMAFAQVSTRDP
jgi:glutamate-1-semialdehyde 2,1-aminomutase